MFGIASRPAQIATGIATALGGRFIRDLATGDFNQSASGITTRHERKMDEASATQYKNYIYALRLAKQQQEASQSSAERAMQFEDEQALRARQWQLEDRESAYQVAVADMKKAGLNPAVMFANGASAASQTSALSGSGHSGSMTAGEADNHTLSSILQESMSNQTAVTTTLINSIGRLLEKLIPNPSALITRAK